MNDLWTNRLSEYIDGELDNTERAALEAHLATCGHCYATLADLRQVVARAKTLEDREPAQDLWAGIRAGLTTDAPIPLRRDRLVRRRFSLTVGQLLAASVALVLLSGGGAWLALKPEPRAAALSPTPLPGTEIAASWTSGPDLAVADLQEALLRNESRLDTATVRVVRQNLAVIDRAIADARAALVNDPGNTYLNLHLANTMRRKLELLRRVNALATES
jgi:putative zinc finger protein